VKERIEYNEKQYWVKAVLDKEKIDFSYNRLKEKYFPVDLILKKGIKIYLLEEIIEIEIGEIENVLPVDGVSGSTNHAKNGRRHTK